MNNLTSMASHYDEVMGDMQAAQAAVSSTPHLDMSHVDKRDYDDMMIDAGVMPGFDRLASLSNQISLLEERMADCKSSRDCLH